MCQIKILIDEEKINVRIKELARQIEKDYKNKDIVFLCVLKGSVVFTVNLAKEIKNNIQFEFIEVSSYEGYNSTGKIKINKDITESIKGKNVIIIEDIIDTGNTLFYLKNYLQEKEPETLKICTLLDKPSRRIKNIEADYVGFVIDNKFVVGYGLDYNQNLRNLNYVGYIEE